MKTKYNNTEIFLIPPEKHADRKLSEENIAEILSLKGKMRPLQVAIKFNVSKQRIWQIWNPEKYKIMLEQKKEYNKKHGAKYRKKYKEKYDQYRRNYIKNRNISYAVEKNMLNKSLDKVRQITDLVYACNYKKITTDELFQRLTTLLEKELREYYSAKAEGKIISLWDLVNEENLL